MKTKKGGRRKATRMIRVVPLLLFLLRNRGGVRHELAKAAQKKPQPERSVKREEEKKKKKKKKKKKGKNTGGRGKKKAEPLNPHRFSTRPVVCVVEVEMKSTGRPPIGPMARIQHTIAYIGTPPTRPPVMLCPRVSRYVERKLAHRHPIARTLRPRRYVYMYMRVCMYTRARSRVD